MLFRLPLSKSSSDNKTEPSGTCHQYKAEIQIRRHVRFKDCRRLFPGNISELCSIIKLICDNSLQYHSTKLVLPSTAGEGNKIHIKDEKSKTNNYADCELLRFLECSKLTSPRLGFGFPNSYRLTHTIRSPTAHLETAGLNILLLASF